MACVQTPHHLYFLDVCNVHSIIHTLQCKGNMRTYTWRIRCAIDYIKTLQIKTLQFDRQGLL